MVDFGYFKRRIEFVKKDLNVTREFVKFNLQQG